MPTAFSLELPEDATLFAIDSGTSEVRFLIDEILRGEPTTVVGSSSQVSGQIAINRDDAKAAVVGPIVIDARTLVTDQALRNRALHGRILQTAAYETITFTPLEVGGLPESVSVGQPVQFEIKGDLSIAGITQPVTFEATAVLRSDIRLEGSASAVITRGDFELFVPAAAGVAAVAENVILEIDFTAEAVKGVQPQGE